MKDPNIFCVSLRLKRFSKRNSGDFNEIELAKFMNSLILSRDWKIMENFYAEDFQILSEKDSRDVVFRIDKVPREDRNYFLQMRPGRIRLDQDYFLKMRPGRIRLDKKYFESIRFMSGLPIAAVDTKMYTGDEMRKIGIVGNHNSTLCVVEPFNSFEEECAAFQCFGVFKPEEYTPVFRKFRFECPEAATFALRILSNEPFKFFFGRSGDPVISKKFIPVSEDTKRKESEYIEKVRRVLKMELE